MTENQKCALSVQHEGTPPIDILTFIAHMHISIIHICTYIHIYKNFWFRYLMSADGDVCWWHSVHPPPVIAWLHHLQMYACSQSFIHHGIYVFIAQTNQRFHCYLWHCGSPHLYIYIFPDICTLMFTYKCINTSTIDFNCRANKPDYARMKGPLNWKTLWGVFKQTSNSLTLSRTNICTSIYSTIHELFTVLFSDRFYSP